MAPEARNTGSRRSRRLLLIPTVIALLAGTAFVAGYRADMPLPLLTAKYAGGASAFADVAGMRVHYRDEGRGETLLLLHGTGSSLHTWDGWVALLERDFRVVRPDLPGFGLTGPHPDGNYTIASYVDFVDAFSRHLGLGRFHLAGNSLGGQIAWNYALARPGRVDKLVLVDASGYPRTDAGERPALFELAKLPLVNRLLEVMTPRSFVAASLRDAYADPARIDDALVDRYYELSLRPGNRRAFIERALDAARDENGDPGDIGQPTLIIWGAEDRWIPLADARAFAAAIDRARLLVYPGVGHVPMEELPGPTARATATFLRD